MTDYLSNLKEDEISYICSVIPAKELRKLYRKHESEFHKIKPGFRSNTLSDEDAIRLAVKNIDKRFIAASLNKKIETWLKQDSEYKAALIQRGVSRERACLLTMKDSVFCHQVGLYFRLAGTAVSEEYLALLQAAVDELLEQPDPPAEEAFQTQTQTEKVVVENADWETERASFIKQNADLRIQLKTAEEKVAQVEANVASLQYSEEKALSELEVLRNRARKMPTAAVSGSDGNYPYASLCIVYTDFKGTVRLSRIADVSENRILDQLDELFPPYRTLYAQDGPTAENFLGIWKWNVTPNERDPSRDYILTSYSGACIPIEVVILQNCFCTDDLVNVLKVGVDRDILAGRIIFAYWDIDANHYAGLLCMARELVYANGSIRFADDVFDLPQYFFAPAEIDTFQKRSFFRTLDLGLPDNVVPVKDPLKVVRDQILERASWSAMKQKGFTRSESKKIREFITELPIADLNNAVSAVIGCNAERSSALIQEFITHASEYISADTIENAILAQVIQNNPELMERCKELLTEEWKKENAAAIADETTVLTKLRDQIATGEKKVQKLSDSYSLKKEQYDLLQAELAERERLSEDVERRVQERIAVAQKNAADFIAEQSFMPRPSVALQSQAAPTSVVFQRGQDLPEESPELHESWSSVIDALQYNLSVAGVAEPYTRYLAAYLYSAYRNRTAILLMGPNGRAIADAFAASIFCKTSAVLHCDSSYTPEAFAELEQSEEAVVVIDGLFAPSWNHHLNAYTQRSESFLIAASPFAEDLQIEPHGILNYWLPVMTELIVDRKPCWEFDSGKLAEKYRDFQPGRISHRYDELLQHIKMSALSRNTIQQVLSDMHAMTKDTSRDPDILLALFPCAYVLGKVGTLQEHQSQMKMSAEAQNLLTAYWGEQL